MPPSPGPADPDATYPQLPVRNRRRRHRPAEGAHWWTVRDHSELRASDADRDATVEALRQAHAEGRLDLDEFEERVGVAYRAKTYGELAAVLRDLPVAGPAPARPVRTRRRQRRPNWSRFVWGNGACWSIWAADAISHHTADGLWPVYVTGPWVAWRVARVIERRRQAPPALRP